MKQTPDGYVLGTHDAELQRLGLQHRLWSEAAFGCWERAGIGPGCSVLDVGCGPGYTTFDLADLAAPGGCVIALDESERFIEHLKTQQRASGVRNVEARVGDVQRLDVPERCVDVAYVRWVLCFVPDPEAVIAGIARALKPGGVLAAQEYLYYRAILLAPDAPAFRRVIDSVHASWLQRGGDPDIGMRLPSLMERHGLRVEEVRPLVRIARPGSPLWQWPDSFFRNNVPLLVGMGLLTQDEQRAFEVAWEERSRDPAAFFQTPPMVEVIARKA